jgi:hypothetical protein
MAFQGLSIPAAVTPADNPDAKANEAINKAAERAVVQVAGQMPQRDANGDDSPSAGKPPPPKDDPAKGQEPQKPADPQRPAWLPEKFKSAEDMAKAYSELETRLGGQKPKEGEQKPDGQQPQTPPAALSEESFTPFVEEFAKTGQLSEESFGKLQQMGIPRTMAEAYMAGQQAIGERQANEIFSLVGGKEQYTEMSAWAQQNLTQAQLKAYNAVVESGDLEQAALAVQGLASQWRAQAGQAPAQVVQGRPAPTGVVPFRTSSEVVQAMKDPRYEKDSTYTKEVDARLAASDMFTSRTY